MDDRCDGIFQCEDKSDGDDCDLFDTDKETYNKDYPPRKEGKPVEVKVNVSIVAIQNIKEIDMTFSTKFTLSLEWYDERIRFSNLKNEDLTNLVGYQNMEKIWIPPLIFNNTKKNIMVVPQPTASLFINKRGNYTVAPPSSVNEDFYYQGSENVFVYKIDYEMTCNCIFNLYEYPFDTQTCEIEVRSTVFGDN